MFLKFIEPQAKQIQISEPSTHEEYQGRSDEEGFGHRNSCVWCLFLAATKLINRHCAMCMDTRPHGATDTLRELGKA